jgi:CDP-glucose 4,6-dehydratase
VENVVTPGALPDPGFWAGKRVLLTGHTGFKGSWLALWLHRLGAQVTGLALAPDTQTNLFTLAGVKQLLDHHELDLRDAPAVAALVRASRPQLVLHLAAQALVRPSYEQPVQTFATNVMGTAHVLDALRGLEGVRAVVAVTTDKVYHNREWLYPYREDDPLGGHDPYSASKAACEMVVASYRESFLRGQGVALASARAGNVIGGGDWSRDRLIPDAVRAWGAGQALDIRRPDAVRPWQHVLEPLAGYLRLAEQLWARPQLAGAYNFGPHTAEAATVRQVVEQCRAAYGNGEVRYGEVPPGPHEAGLLALETVKAAQVLGVVPRWKLPQALQRTMAWYRQCQAGSDARALCLADLAAYEAGTP